MEERKPKPDFAREARDLLSLAEWYRCWRRERVGWNGSATPDGIAQKAPLTLCLPGAAGRGRVDKRTVDLLRNRVEPMTPIRQEVHMKRSAGKLRPDDLRRIAAKTPEPERERKMLVLAERLEEAERASEPDGDDTPAHTKRSGR